MKVFLEINQIKKLLSSAQDNLRDSALLHLAFNTGFRISDLLSLERDQLLSKSKKSIVPVLRIKTKKTGVWLDKPLRNDCRHAIREYLSSRNDNNPYMFPPTQTISRYGENTSKPMSRMTAHRLFKKYLSEVIDPDQLARSSTHTLRRSVGKIISEKAGRIEPATKFLGHASIVTTAAYIDMDSHEAAANEIIGGITL